MFRGLYPTKKLPGILAGDRYQIIKSWLDKNGNLHEIINRSEMGFTMANFLNDLMRMTEYNYLEK